MENRKRLNSEERKQISIILEGQRVAISELQNMIKILEPVDSSDYEYLVRAKAEIRNSLFYLNKLSDRK